MSKYARPELLAPAGSIHHVRAALSYGADAVYAGIPRWSLRVRGNGFTREDFKTGIELAHSMGKKFFAVLNVIPHARRLSTFEEDLDSVAALKPDAFIMADPGLIDLALTRHPEIPVHLSVQANTVNPLSVKFWQKLGVRRCILARELSLSEIGIIREACPDMELEVLGTSFNIRSYKDERTTVTTLFTGRIGQFFPEAGTSLELSPAQRSVFSRQKKSVRTEKADVREALAWKEGKIVARNERLEDIFVMLSRWYNFKVCYTRPELKDMRFHLHTNRYKSIREVLDNLTATKGIQVDYFGDTIYIR